MGNALIGLPGGATESVTIAAIALDLRALARHDVKIWSDEQDLYFCFAADASNTTLLTGGSNAASTTALVADRAAKGFGIVREVSEFFPYLIVQTVTGAGEVKVKPVDRPLGATT